MSEVGFSNSGAANGGGSSSDGEDATIANIEKLNTTLKSINRAHKTLEKQRDATVKEFEAQYQQILDTLEETKKRAISHVQAAYSEVDHNMNIDKQTIYAQLKSVVPSNESQGGKASDVDSIQARYTKEFKLPSVTIKWDNLNATVEDLIAIDNRRVDLKSEAPSSSSSSRVPAKPQLGMISKMSAAPRNSTPREPTLPEKSKPNRLARTDSEFLVAFTKQLEDNRASRIQYRKKKWNLNFADFACITIDRLLIADNTEGVVKVLNWEGSEEIQFPVAVEDDTEAAYISGIAVTSEDEILVTDRQNNCLKLFSEDGLLLSKVGKFGRLSGEFISPEGLCVYKDLAFVCDFGNNRIVKVNLRDVRKEAAFFRHNKVPGFVFGPSDITVDKYERLVVSEWGKGRVVLKSAAGELFHKIGGQENTDSALSGPSGVQVDSNGRYYVADALQQKVKIYDKQGEFEGAFVPWHHGAEVHCIRLRPNNNQLCVVDYAKGDIIIFNN